MDEGNHGTKENIFNTQHEIPIPFFCQFTKLVHFGKLLWS